MSDPVALRDIAPLAVIASEAPRPSPAGGFAVLPCRFASRNDGVDRECGAKGVAIGVGFRKACSAETLVALVEAARKAADLPNGTSATLVTIAEKDRPVLHEAARRLDLPVLILPKQALAGTEDRTTVDSALAMACLGVPSVAEAAALAAAGSGSRLLVPRLSVADATCAIAVGTDIA